MQVGGVSLDLTLIMHEQAFGDYLTDHSFLSLESVGWKIAQLSGGSGLVDSPPTPAKLTKW